jgi:hypothetical protein
MGVLSRAAPVSLDSVRRTGAFPATRSAASGSCHLDFLSRHERGSDRTHLNHVHPIFTSRQTDRRLDGWRGGGALASWFLRRWYSGEWDGIAWSVLVEFQRLKCPHPACNRPIVGRFVRLSSVHGPPTQEIHYDLGRSLEAVALLRVTGPRDESSGIFPVEEHLVHVSRDQLSDAARAKFPVVTADQASRFGTVVGTKVREENS